jgi:hypothetical protein
VCAGRHGLRCAHEPRPAIGRSSGWGAKLWTLEQRRLSTSSRVKLRSHAGSGAVITTSHGSVMTACLSRRSARPSPARSLRASCPLWPNRAVEGMVIRGAGGGAHRSVAHQVSGQHADHHAACVGAGAAGEEARRLAWTLGVPVDRGHIWGPDSTRASSSARSSPARSGRACTRTPCGTWSRLGSTPRGCRRGRSPTTWGHERVSMTQDVYMARRVTGAAASAALDRFMPDRKR